MLNNDWVNCNLPWDISLQDVSYKEPDLSHRARLEVPNFDQMNNINYVYLCDYYYKKYDEFQKLYPYLEDGCQKYEDYILFIKGLLITESKSDLDLRLFIDHDKWLNIYYNWLNRQPEIIAYDQELEVKSQSFYHSEFNKPGTLIEVLNSNGDIKQYLIGHINSERAIGDSNYSAFDCNSIILRYKIVYCENA